MYQIIEATEKDYLEVNRLVRQGHEDHVAGDASVFKQVNCVMPKEYYMELLEQENSKVFIVKAERIIGFAVITIECASKFASLIQRKFAYIHDFGVDRSVKRQGIGSLLFEACVNWAKEQNVESVELNVWEFNEEAIAFYEKYNMKTISRKMRLEF
ncbi:GNAT family N-acetyltransferase [Solibacillus sp. FSL H8-0523]|uniref:GNAT family N-acetyltransferase n=1 Tax=Solibacillus sp. FSL H8-0523 TaxID=2954511 RepID=UPI003100E24F